jgi:hypothetical protein
MIGFVLAVLALAIMTVSMVFFYCRLGFFWPSQAPAKIIPAPILWRYGDVAWTGFLRMAPVIIGGWTFLVASGWCFMLLTSLGRFEFVSNQAARDWLGWGLTVGFVGMLAAVPLTSILAQEVQLKSGDPEPQAASAPPGDRQVEVAEAGL